MATLPANHPYALEVKTIVPLVREVSRTVNDMYLSQHSATYTKGDGSPVTDADIVADRILREGIRRHFAMDALLTEESQDTSERLQHSRCWIVDPIDGTAQFVARTGLFDILLALVVDGRPDVSICAHPVTDLVTIAVRDHGAWRVDEHDQIAPIRFTPPAAPPRLASSRYYGAEDYETPMERIAEELGSGPIPVMDVGYGPRAFLPPWRSYDSFVGFWKKDGNSPVREWDLAACDLLTTEAGGAFTDLYGNRYRYNQPSPRPRSGLLASSSPGLHDRVLNAAAPFLPAAPPLVPAS
jgi:3'(2'), 5'-bisphosphate nucleotidase